MRRELSFIFYGFLLIAAVFSVSLTGCVVAPSNQGVPAAAPADVDYNSAVEPLPPEEVNHNTPVQAPPPLQFAEPPDVVVVPSGEGYVYMVPNMTGVYFYNNYWYRYDRGYWFRASIYNGPWGYVETTFVPQIIVSVPPEYPRYLPYNYQRIHYNDFRRNWKSWDHDRYWKKQDWFKRESRADVRRDRYSHIRAEREKRHVEERRSPAGVHHPPPDTRLKPDTHATPETRATSKSHVKPETRTTPRTHVKPREKPTTGNYKPATRQPQTIQPTTRQREIRQPAIKQPATKQPATKQPATKRPAIKQPVIKQHVQKQDEKVNEK
jgi:hypothetical protein